MVGSTPTMALMPDAVRVFVDASVTNGQRHSELITVADSVSRNSVSRLMHGRCFFSRVKRLSKNQGLTGISVISLRSSRRLLSRCG